MIEWVNGLSSKLHNQKRHKLVANRAFLVVHWTKRSGNYIWVVALWGNGSTADAPFYTIISKYD